MRRAVHAEWTKLRTLPSTVWLVLAAAVGTVLLSAAVVASVNTAHCPSPAECFEDTTKLSLTGVRLGQALVAVLAVLVVGNEYGTGMMQVTLAATPRRSTVLLGKAAVVVACVLAAAIPAVLGSLAAGRAILPGNGFTAANGYPALTLADGPTLRAAAGTVLYLVLVALLALGVAAALRDTAGALVSVLTLLYVFPIIGALMSDPQVQKWLDRLTPMTAGLAVQATTSLDRLHIGPWAGLGVLAGYAAAALALGGYVFVRKDA